jgi:ribosome recycling factor
MVSNLNPLGGSSVGADSLAAARNNVATAAQLVGSEEVLEAVARDQLDEMRAINQVAMTPIEVQENMAVQKMIDARANQLMQQPIQRADGSVSPMGYDRAMRLATDQINMELRAGQVY